jgi:putative ABC transport system permease protein
VGLLLAAPVSRLIRPYLFGLGSIDLVTYGLVLAVLAVAAMAASYLPTRRAVRLDPIRALHYE